MKVYLVELQEYNKVRFYTLRKEGEVETETEQFFTRFSGSDYKPECELIVALLKNMGKVSGAQDRFFRPEKEGHAIPSYKAINFIESDNEYEEGKFHLRLYCFRISQSIVILGNGGIKTSQTYQDSPECKPHAELMQRFIKAFDAALHNGDGAVFIFDDKIYLRNNEFEI